ncbi:HIT family protein [Azonexus sp. R2A61]|uniref:HIT family protein n=1 Tax=Azonexus sp. R2A61 TaxID=2744443 RepID=UPI001F39C3D7|nr:HIT family protein [Azonexus sp. R2A61]
MPEFVDTSAVGSCIFCRLLAGEIPAARIYEDEQTLAFLDIGQVTPGHTLVIVKRHAETLFDLTADEAAAAMRTAHRVAQAIQATFQPAGLNLLQCNREAGWQTVGHFHIHVLPRHADDGVGLIWPRQEPGRDVLAERAALLREALAGQD